MRPNRIRRRAEPSASRPAGTASAGGRVAIGDRGTIEICRARREHLDALGEIERAAADLFDERDLPAHLRDETISAAEHLEAQRQGLLLVALAEDFEPVGFAIMREAGPALHLLEMDVHPRWQRRGIGTALLEGVVALARHRGFGSVTLTTYRYVPWNAPWYASHGFSMVAGDELGEHLQAVLRQEQARGLDRERRVAMRRDLAACDSPT